MEICADPGGHQQGRPRSGLPRVPRAQISRQPPRIPQPARQPEHSHHGAPASGIPSAADQRAAGSRRRRLLEIPSQYRGLQTANGRLAAWRSRPAWMWERIDAGSNRHSARTPGAIPVAAPAEGCGGAHRAPLRQESAFSAIQGKRASNQLNSRHPTSSLKGRPCKTSSINWRNSALARLGGGQKRIDAQHAKGKLTARERIELLMDDGTFEEWDMFVEHRCTDFGMEANKIPGDGVVTGYGLINGRLAFVFSQTSRWRRLVRDPCREDLQDHGPALKNRCPLIGLRTTWRRAHPGRRKAFGRICRSFQRNVKAIRCDSPDLGMIMGPCAGRRLYSLRHDRFHLMMVEDTSYMFVHRTECCQTVTNEEVTN